MAIWVNKSPDRIINDINRFIDECKNMELYCWPYWSVGSIDTANLERLEEMRQSIAIHFEVPVNSIIFLGTTSEKDDVWCLSSERKIIKIGGCEKI